MPSPLDQRVEALERQLADMQAMLESLLACVQRQQADAAQPFGQDQRAAKITRIVAPQSQAGNNRTKPDKIGQNRTK